MQNVFLRGGLVACLTIFLANADTPPRKLSLKELNQPAKLPNPLPTQLKANQPPMMPVFFGRTSKTNLEQSTGILRYLSRQGQQQQRPFFEYHLARAFLELNQDAAAWQTFQDVLNLPPGTPYAKASPLMPASLKELQTQLQLELFHLLARNGLNQDATKILPLVKPQTGYDHIKFAESLMLLNDEKACLRELDQALARRTGHPEGNWGDKFIPMHAVVLARCLNRPDLALQYGQAILNRGENAEKWPQWKATWFLVSQAIEQASATKQTANTSYKAGTYVGTSRGYIGEIEVKVTIANNRIDDVKVTRQREDRPWSAIDVIPRRILLHQRIAVDAVSGATISSNAIQLATDQALEKAVSR